MRAFITSQFQYCPLIWMFHGRQLNKKINKIQESALRITYKDAESTYSELLEKDCAVTIHTKNLQLLMTEMYKTRNDLNPSFMQEIFCENESHYNLRNNNEFVQPRVRSVGNDTESVRFKGPQLWQMLPQTIRNSGSLAQFNPISPGGGGWIPPPNRIFGYVLFRMCGMILRSPDFDPLSNYIQNVKTICSSFRNVSMATDFLLCTLWRCNFIFILCFRHCSD